jgi:hypothetical protein
MRGGEGGWETGRTTHMYALFFSSAAACIVVQTSFETCTNVRKSESGSVRTLVKQTKSMSLSVFRPSELLIERTISSKRL